MNQKRIFCILVLFITASLDICLARYLEQHHGVLREKSQLQNQEEAVAVLRAFELPKEVYEELTEGEETDTESDAASTDEDESAAENRNADAHETAFGNEEPEMSEAAAENVLAYLFCRTTEKSVLKKWCRREKEAEPELFAGYTQAVQKILSDMVYFPVPESLTNARAGISYENSWQSERTYGGVRGHEGCDIMAGTQIRGYYPVISVSDGVVEKTGWLPQGGYRIGIRSRCGVYFYYAHLAEYEEGLEEGMEIAAGQLLGYMGDTGYSEVEGTTGNFPVHLHFGVYLDDEKGSEVSFNPYYLLEILKQHKLKYEYRAAAERSLHAGIKKMRTDIVKL